MTALSVPPSRAVDDWSARGGVDALIEITVVAPSRPKPPVVVLSGWGHGRYTPPQIGKGGDEMGRRAFRATCVTVVALGALAASAGTAEASPNVLLVGTYNGTTGPYATIQAAVNAASAGDWILVGPGDYHERGDYATPTKPAGVAISTSNLHLRGMNRNSVVVDGTTPGSPTCSGAAGDQDPGPSSQGRNGIEVFGKTGGANNVSIENLTVCNFLTDSSGGNGNEIWWNGGDGGGHVNMNGYTGNYLTATSTYSNYVNYPAGSYGIFVSDATNGSWTYDYASNMADSDYYIGACQQVCNATMNHDHGQDAALCLSSTNAGGYILVENTECDQNKTGLVSNSQNNDDWPAPQHGACPSGGTGPFPTQTASCTVWAYNYLHDNNNPNVPGNGTSGLAGGGPVGTGAILAGTQNVTLYHNTIANNDSWGELVADLPDQEQAPSDAPDCNGGTLITPSGPSEVCLFRAIGNISLDNTFITNGGNGNPGNGDIGLATLPNSPGNCFSGDTDSGAVGGIATSDPPGMELNPAFQPSGGTCTVPNTGDMGASGSQALCSSQLLAPCPSIKDYVCAAITTTPCPFPGVPGNNYPRPNQATFALHMPPPQTTMADPCAGVPANAFCAPATGVPEFPLVAAPVAGLAVVGAVALGRRRRTMEA